MSTKVLINNELIRRCLFLHLCLHFTYVSLNTLRITEIFSVSSAIGIAY